MQMEVVLAEIDAYQCDCAHDDGLRECPQPEPNPWQGVGVTIPLVLP